MVVDERREQKTRSLKRKLLTSAILPQPWIQLSRSNAKRTKKSSISNALSTKSSRSPCRCTNKRFRTNTGRHRSSTGFLLASTPSIACTRTTIHESKRLYPSRARLELMTSRNSIRGWERFKNTTPNTQMGSLTALNSNSLLLQRTQRLGKLMRSMWRRTVCLMCLYVFIYWSHASIAIGNLFSGEESYGKYLDLYAHHTAYSNLRHAPKRVAYLQYLDVLIYAQNGTVHSELPRECRITRDYEKCVT